MGSVWGFTLGFGEDKADAARAKGIPGGVCARALHEWSSGTRVDDDHPSGQSRLHLAGTGGRPTARIIVPIPDSHRWASLSLFFLFSPMANPPNNRLDPGFTVLIRPFSCFATNSKNQKKHTQCGMRITAGNTTAILFFIHSNLALVSATAHYISRSRMVQSAPGLQFSLREKKKGGCRMAVEQKKCNPQMARRWVRVWRGTKDHTNFVAFPCFGSRSPGEKFISSVL